MEREIAGVSEYELVEPLRTWIESQRWFGRRERVLADVVVADAACIRDGEDAVWFVVIETSYQGGGGDLFAAPLGIRRSAGTTPEDVTVHTDGDVTFVDAIADPQSASAFWQAMRDNSAIETRAGELRFFGEVAPGTIDGVHRLTAETTNSQAIRGDLEFFKWVRHVEDGPSVELEMTNALVAGGFTNICPPKGGVDYARGNTSTRLGFLSTFLADNIDAWKMAQDALAAGSSFVVEAAQLGEVTARMHLALSGDAIANEMRARTVDADMAAEWAAEIRADFEELMSSSHPKVAELAPRKAALAAPIEAMEHLRSWGMAERIHGDYHLGQVSQSRGEWFVLDFEGEPARSHAERRQHMSPLRDVAGMLRSFDYAGAVFASKAVAPGDDAFEAKVAEVDPWVQACRDAFWHAYLATVGTNPLLPEGSDLITLRTALEVQKALYEVRYELGHRPNWVPIPLRFLASVGS